MIPILIATATVAESTESKYKISGGEFGLIAFQHIQKLEEES